MDVLGSGKKAKLNWSNETLLELFTQEVKNQRVLCTSRELGKNYVALAEYLNLCAPGSSSYIQGPSLQSKFSDLSKDVQKKVIDLKGRPYTEVNYNEMAELKTWERTLLDALCDRDRFQRENPTEAALRSATEDIESSANQQESFFKTLAGKKRSFPKVEGQPTGSSSSMHSSKRSSMVVDLVDTNPQILMDRFRKDMLLQTADSAVQQQRIARVRKGLSKAIKIIRRLDTKAEYADDIDKLQDLLVDADESEDEY